MIRQLKKYYFKEISITLAILIVVSFILTIWFSLGQSFRIVFGSLFVLFLPGFFLTFIFFPKSRLFFDDTRQGFANNEHALDWIERPVLSIFFSITLTTLTLTVIWRLNISLTPLIVALVVLSFNLLTIIGVLIIFRWRRDRRRSKKEKKTC